MLYKNKKVLASELSSYRDTVTTCVHYANVNLAVSVIGDTGQRVSLTSTEARILARRLVELADQVDRSR